LKIPEKRNLSVASGCNSSRNFLFGFKNGPDHNPSRRAAKRVLVLRQAPAGVRLPAAHDFNLTSPACGEIRFGLAASEL
jgi:hypothetical protein